jgi:hypothetical protein
VIIKFQLVNIYHHHHHITTTITTSSSSGLNLCHAFFARRIPDLNHGPQTGHDHRGYPQHTHANFGKAP